MFHQKKKERDECQQLSEWLLHAGKFSCINFDCISHIDRCHLVILLGGVTENLAGE